jgi:hypothetical protein
MEENITPKKLNFKEEEVPEVKQDEQKPVEEVKQEEVEVPPEKSS